MRQALPAGRYSGRLLAASAMLLLTAGCTTLPEPGLQQLPIAPPAVKGSSATFQVPHQPAQPVVETTDLADGPTSPPTQLFAAARLTDFLSRHGFRHSPKPEAPITTAEAADADASTTPNTANAAALTGDEKYRLTGAAALALERGNASWYGGQFHGRRTANGEQYNKYALTAAHKTLPFGTIVRVRSLKLGREVDVRINDRGPFTPGRVIDVSQAAAQALGLTGLGVTEVSLNVAATLGEMAPLARSGKTSPRLSARTTPSLYQP